MPVLRPLPAAAPPRLGSALESWMLSPPDGTSLAIGPAGELFVRATDSVHLRLEGLRALRGGAEREPAPRRARGRTLDGDLGGDPPISAVRGPVAAVLVPPAGMRFVGLTLENDNLYVREDALFAFDAGVGYESGRLAIPGATLDLVQLHGRGALVLLLPRAPAALAVTESEPVHVAPDALVGWTGRLFPDGAAKPMRESGLVAFRGEGVLLVT
jgi:hypothetical protein